MKKTKKICSLTFLPHTLPKKNLTNLPTFPHDMMCQIYNTRNKNPVITGRKNGQKERLSKDERGR